jgi:hypothetical protein
MERLHDMGASGGVVDYKTARQGGAFGYWVHRILRIAGTG